MHWLGAWVEQYAAEQEVVAEVKRLGGDAEIERSAAVGQSIGEDFATVFERLVGIAFHGPRIGDSVVDYLVAQHGTLAGLRSLALVQCRLSNAAVARLRVFSNLRRLDLRGTPISYRAIRPLWTLTELEGLELEGTRVPWWRRLAVKWRLRGHIRARAEATPGLPGS